MRAAECFLEILILEILEPFRFKHAMLVVSHQILLEK